MSKPAGDVVTLPTIEQRADRYFADLAWKALNKPRLDRIDDDAKYFRAQYDLADATKTFYAHGEVATIIIGPRENQRTVGVAKALKIWGTKVISKLLKITIGDLEKTVGKDVAAQAIATAQSGSRPLTAIPKQKGTE